jgi:thiamine biosynthesis protein ThiI
MLMRRVFLNSSSVPAVLLVRYGELALKSPPVRREFERTLRRNILDQFVAAGLTCRLRTDRGHFYVETEDGAAGVRAVRRVFGITSVSIVWETPTERAPLRERMLELADPHLAAGRSFAVRARRTGQHPFTSQELARDLGSDILDKWPDRGLHVDLEHPEVEVFVEVRGPRTYLSFDRQKGPGGLPMGVAGRVVALVDGPRGALGAYLMMKRGCRIDLVATTAGLPFAKEVLIRFDPKGEVAVPDGGIPGAEDAIRGLAESHRADGVVLPLGVEDYPAARLRWGDRVVFSPTVGLTDEEVHSRWRGVVELAG